MIQIAVLSGVGAVAVIKEKVERSVDDMVKRDKIQKEEGLEFVRSLSATTTLVSSCGVLVLLPSVVLLTGTRFT